MFAHSWAAACFGCAFTLLLVLAIASDVRHRRIPNALVVATISLGIAFALSTLGVVRGSMVAAEGMVVGLALWLPWWWFGMMGAGDVKFFAAAAAWLGPRGALSAALVTALLGGVLGIAWVLARKLVRSSAGDGRTVAAEEGAGARRATVTLPYGVAMALGLGVAAWIPLIR
ncbi:MAG TPA: prepilin peptidase [Gemmatimonadaceae bacterium]|nr:prepilin peptidase [Gemmatimonadaceae bacterium]